MSNANEFLAELYARFDKMNPLYNRGQIEVETFLNSEIANHFLDEYRLLLPQDKTIKILDIGVGEGWFASVCHKLGYENIEMVDYGCTSKFSDIRDSLNSIKDVYDVETTIKDLMKQEKFHDKYDFIHMSHVIEHIPKHDLIETMDALSKSLRNSGTLFVRTPNLLGPVPFYSLYCTPGHEYGFIPSNLSSFFLISDFENVKVHVLESPPKGIAQFFGHLLRKLYLLNAKIKYRVFEGVFPESVSPELIMSGTRKINE